jgi:alpha-glucosidase
MWWEQAVIYQIYVRSFQDSDGDGIGDLPGIVRRLPYIAELGVQAIWLSPIYPSPNADFGYDVSNFTEVEPAFGTLADLDQLLNSAHELGLKVLLDFVPCHTSIEHPWFRSAPDRYVWADSPPNNWRAAFGGSAWELDGQTGRYYLSSFFPEQADLDWRNPAVPAAVGEALRFWLERGVDGYRLDALDRLLKDPELRDDPPAKVPFPLPIHAEDARLEHVHSRNATDIGRALAQLREACGSHLLVGEVYLPVDDTRPYLDAMDIVFNFEALHSAADPGRLRQAIAGGLAAGQQGWVLSNHDFSRLATRAGEVNARAEALLLLGLPGPSFMLAGDELGLGDGLMLGPAEDRNGRDPFRVPMAWDDSPASGFTTGTPWLAVEPRVAPVSDQDANPESTLTLLRSMIALKGRLSGDTQLLDSAPKTIVIKRGDHMVAVNLGDQDRDGPAGEREIVLEARPGDGADPRRIPAHGGWIARPSG